MENIEIVEIETSNGIQTHVILDRGNGEYTSMLKSTWDEQQKAAELGGTL